ncbi:MAG: hypothetical protein N2C14_05000, partial [Planctomycetales bacterium]
LRWGYAGELSAVRQLTIRAPLFDEFFFEDDPPGQRDPTLAIQTSKGAIELKAELSEEVIGGKRYRLLTTERTLIAGSPGTHDAPPVTATFRKVTRWARDLLGGRSPVAVVPVRKTGAPVKIVVKPLPLQGRPESFAGAVGEGFSVETAADRTVVRVGDPISLTIKVRGSGNLEHAGLPALSADGGLNPQRFRLPDGDSSGHFEDNQKTFAVNVRVLDQSVSEIPAIAYSWFHPEEGVYRTARSKPIALRVNSSRVISARDVVSTTASNHSGSGDSNAPRKTDEPKRNAGTSDAFALSGADLAIERDPTRVLRDARDGQDGAWLRWGVYLGGLALVALAFLDRKRRDAPEETTRRRKLLSAQRRRVEQTLGKPRREAAREIADALRLVAAETPESGRAAAGSVSAECEDVVYAPDDDRRDPIDPGLVQRALQAMVLASRESA